MAIHPPVAVCNFSASRCLTNLAKGRTQRYQFYVPPARCPADGCCDYPDGCCASCPALAPAPARPSSFRNSRPHGAPRSPRRFFFPAGLQGAVPGRRRVLCSQKGAAELQRARGSEPEAQGGRQPQGAREPRALRPVRLQRDGRAWRRRPRWRCWVGAEAVGWGESVALCCLGVAWESSYRTSHFHPV